VKNVHLPIRAVWIAVKERDPTTSSSFWQTFRPTSRHLLCETTLSGHSSVPERCSWRSYSHSAVYLRHFGIQIVS